MTENFKVGDSVMLSKKRLKETGEGVKYARSVLMRKVYDVSGVEIDWVGELNEKIAQLAGYEISMRSGEEYFLRRR